MKSIRVIISLLVVAAILCIGVAEAETVKTNTKATTASRLAPLTQAARATGFDSAAAGASSQMIDANGFNSAGSPAPIASTKPVLAKPLVAKPLASKPNATVPATKTAAKPASKTTVKKVTAADQANIAESEFDSSESESAETFPLILPLGSPLYPTIIPLTRIVPLSPVVMLPPYTIPLPMSSGGGGSGSKPDEPDE